MKIWSFGKLSFRENCAALYCQPPLFSSSRHQSLCTSGVDSLQPVQRQSGHRLELRDPLVRHGHRRHPLWDGRTDLQRQHPLPQEAVTRLEQSFVKAPILLVLASTWHCYQTTYSTLGVSIFCQWKPVVPGDRLEADYQLLCDCNS